MPRKMNNPLPPLQLPGSQSIGSRIAILRKQKGFTQKELAEKIGIMRALVCDYEVGRLHLNDDMLIRFCIALDASADKVLGLDGKALKEKSLKRTKWIKEMEMLSAADQKKVAEYIQMLNGKK